MKGNTVALLLASVYASSTACTTTSCTAGQKRVPSALNATHAHQLTQVKVTTGSKLGKNIADTKEKREILRRVAQIKRRARKT